MKNLIKKRKGESSWITWIKKRIKNNLNFLAIAEGPTGIGKSWAMIRVAYEIDEEFEPRQIAFGFRQVMEIINSDWFKKKKYKVIVFDEVQVSLSNRQWQSLVNKLFNYLLSTFRHQNIIMLFTSPYSDFIDSQTMKLIHCKFETKGHSEKTKLTHIRPKLLQYNSKLKKFYEHSLFVIINNKYQKIINWKIKKPPEHLVIPYEKDKTEFTNGLNINITEELDNIEAKKEIKKRDLRFPNLTPREIEAILLYEVHRNNYKVSKKMGITPDGVRKLFQTAKKRGFSFEMLDFGIEKEKLGEKNIKTPTEPILT